MIEKWKNEKEEDSWEMKSVGKTKFGKLEEFEKKKKKKKATKNSAFVHYKYHSNMPVKS